MGIIALFESLLAIIIILFGAFVGFSYTNTVIDIAKKRIKFSNNIFGIIPFGKWITISHDMKIGIRKSNKIWRTYSRSNRKFDLNEKCYLINLFDSNDRIIVPIKKVENLDLAKSEGLKIAKQLNINVI